MSTTVDKIEARQNTLRLRTERQRREARIRFWRVFTVSSFFIVVLGANLYIGAVVMMGKYGNPFTTDKSPVKSTALLKRPMLDGVFCRNIVYDNATSHAIEEKIERCEKPASQQKIKSQTQFNWGGK